MNDKLSNQSSEVRRYVSPVSLVILIDTESVICATGEPVDIEEGEW